MAAQGRSQTAPASISTQNLSYDVEMYHIPRCGHNYNCKWHCYILIVISIYKSLIHTLWPVLAIHFPKQNILFQDDNAPIHRAYDVKNYKARNRINCIR